MTTPIDKGEGGFLDRDLYPFCGNVSDGKILALANPQAKQLIGTDPRALKDAIGKAYDRELYDAAQKPEGQVTEVSYLFTRPGDPKPAPQGQLRDEGRRHFRAASVITSRPF